MLTGKPIQRRGMAKSIWGLPIPVRVLATSTRKVVTQLSWESNVPVAENTAAMGGVGLGSGGGVVDGVGLGSGAGVAVGRGVGTSDGVGLGSGVALGPGAVSGGLAGGVGAGPLGTVPAEGAGEMSSCGTLPGCIAAWLVASARLSGPAKLVGRASGPA